jgi:hypothetical protein
MVQNILTYMKTHPVRTGALLILCVLLFTNTQFVIGIIVGTLLHKANDNGVTLKSLILGDEYNAKNATTADDA